MKQGKSAVVRVRKGGGKGKVESLAAAAALSAMLSPGGGVEESVNAVVTPTEGGLLNFDNGSSFEKVQARRLPMNKRKFFEETAMEGMEKEAMVSRGEADLLMELASPK